MAPQAQAATFDEYIQNYRRNSGHPIRILLHFFKGSGRDLTISTIALIAKQSPMWVTPIVTRNIINCATDPASHSVTEMVINLIIGVFFIAQNIGTAYLYIRHFGKVNRLIERRLRGSLIAKLQQLSIRFHTETQSGRLKSKIMRDVENVEVLLDQTCRSLPLVILDIIIAVTVTAVSSPTVLVFFALAIPTAIFAIWFFRRPIRESNITYGLEHVDDAEVDRIIDEVGLDDVVAQLPQGLDTLIGEHGGTLSGGQKQRITIARPDPPSATRTASSCSNTGASSNRGRTRSSWPPAASSGGSRPCRSSGGTAFPQAATATIHRPTITSNHQNHQNHQRRIRHGHSQRRPAVP